jgi:hypothetical protein
MTVSADRTSSRSANAGLPKVRLSKPGRPEIPLAKGRLSKFGSKFGSKLSPKLSPKLASKLGPKVGLPKSGLPKRFPIGATYVVEGRRSDGSGGLRVISRYVLLPSGRRINLAADHAELAARRPAAAKTARRLRARRGKKSSALRGTK